MTHKTPTSPKPLSDKLNSHINGIIQEYENAVKKHPKFCDIFTSGTPEFWRNAECATKLEYDLKEKHGEPIEAADILYEEAAEAFNAISQKKWPEAKKELYQVAQVCIRIAEEIDKAQNG